MSQLNSRALGGSVDDADITSAIDASQVQQLSTDLQTLLARFGDPSVDTSASTTIAGTLKAILEGLSPDIEYITYSLNADPDTLLSGYAKFNNTTGQPEYFDASNNQLTPGTFTVEAQGNQDFEVVVEYWDAIADQAGGSPEYLDGHCLRETRFYDNGGSLILTVWDNVTTQTVLSAPPASGDITRKVGSSALTGITSVTGYASVAGTGYVLGDRILVVSNQDGAIQHAINLSQGTLLSGFAIGDIADLQEEKPQSYISDARQVFANGSAAAGLTSPPATANRAVIEYEAYRTNNDKAITTPAARVKIEGGADLPDASDGALRYHGDVETLENASEIADFRFFRLSTSNGHTIAVYVRYYTC